MNRRLYFLLPSVDLTEKVISELTTTGIAPDHIHVHAQKAERVDQLPNYLNEKQLMMSQKIENTIWYSNLAIFFIALILLTVALFWGSYLFMGMTVPP